MENWTIDVEVLFDGRFITPRTLEYIAIPAGEENPIEHFQVVANIEICNIEIITTLTENGIPRNLRNAQPNWRVRAGFGLRRILGLVRQLP